MSRKTQGLTERYPAQLIVPVVDILVIIASSLLAYWWRFGNLALHERYTLAIAVIALLVVLLNSLLGAYARWRVTRISTLLGRLLVVWLAVAVMATSFIYFAQAAERYSRLWVGSSLLLSFIFSGGVRVAAQLILRKARLKGKARRSVFLVGPGPNLTNVAHGMRASVDIMD
ncbi:hypothetical protein JJO83_15755 [Halomonas aquamarina]|uniref:hypothetical protein n=1 Tax=Vreelandella aquamarina TaxID=77097 RepID=UPI00235A0067|nr:hypothetical protein [Halomonas aquamarina]MDC8444132.1 hypothetical protein [Halomonas aquamarina]